MGYGLWVIELEAVDYAEAQAEVADGFFVPGVGVFGFGGEVEAGEGLVGESGLDAPEVFKVVAAAEAMGEVRIAVVEVLGVAKEEAGAPVGARAKR